MQIIVNPLFYYIFYQTVVMHNKILAIEEGVHYDERIKKRQKPDDVNIDSLYDSRMTPGNYCWFYYVKHYSYMAKLKPSEILDVACGSGFLSVLLARFGHKVHAVDISGKSIEYAQELVKVNNQANNITLERMDVCNLTFNDNTFDVVTGENVVHHIIKYNGALENLYRVLKPGGVAIFWEPFKFNPMINIMRAINVRIRNHEGEAFLGKSDLEKIELLFDEVIVTQRSVVYVLSRFFYKPTPFNRMVNIFLKKIDNFLQSFFPFLDKFYSLAYLELYKK